MKYPTMFLITLVFLWVGYAMADTPQEVEAIINKRIVIEGGESARMSVVFSHKSHKKIACENCHHETSSDTPYSSCREACHSEPGARERDPMSMFMAFHAKDTDRSCYGCHYQLATESPKKYPGFKGCRPCHTSGSGAAAAKIKAGQ